MGNQFGGKITRQLLEKYAQSPHWDGEKFVNLEETIMEMNLGKVPGLLMNRYFNNVQREPSSALPIIPFNEQNFLEASNKMKFIWYGHSVMLIRMNNKTILIDPMLGPDASPVAPFSTKRF